MKRVLALPVILAAVAAGGALMLNAAMASGTGGPITLGVVGGSGNTRTVEVLTGASTDPWSGYNIHVAAAVGGGLTLNSIGDANGSLLNSPAPTCFESNPAANHRVYGCVTLGAARASVTAAGQLAVFTFNTTGNGCLVANLVSVPGNSTTNTYTIDRASSTPQSNALDTTPISILIGTGTNADCPSAAAPTNTPTNTPTKTPTIVPTATATPVPGDSDSDGYLNALELTLGENPNLYCGIMRADVDGDGAVSILDFTQVATWFLQSSPPAPQRLDQGPTFDGNISILDLATMSGYFLKHVAECPN